MNQAQHESDNSNTSKDHSKKNTKKKYDPVDYCQPGTYLDAKDSVNSWCMAQIIERCDSDNTLKINFDGWSHRWDEVTYFFYHF